MSVLCICVSLLACRCLSIFSDVGTMCIAAQIYVGVYPYSIISIVVRAVGLSYPICIYKDHVYPYIHTYSLRCTFCVGIYDIV
jgi:hypothetical protein